MSAQSQHQRDSKSATPAGTTVIFDLDPSTTAAPARLRLQNSSTYIVTSAKPHGELPGQVIGSTIHVVVEAQGNPDDFVLINVQHATPTTIKMKVSEGPGTKPLLVTG
jgi:hypothetical protein